MYYPPPPDEAERAHHGDCVKYTASGIREEEKNDSVKKKKNHPKLAFYTRIIILVLSGRRVYLIHTSRSLKNTSFGRITIRSFTERFAIIRSVLL